MVEVEDVMDTPPKLDMEADSERWRICSSMDPVPLTLLWLLRRATTSETYNNNGTVCKCTFQA